MVDFELTNAYSPMLFSADGYQLVVMPKATPETNEQAKRDREAKEAAQPKAEAAVTEQAESVTEPEVTETVAEAEAIVEAKAKPKRSRKRDKIAVA